jgi:hypothetical protein
VDSAGKAVANSATNPCQLLPTLAGQWQPLPDNGNPGQPLLDGEPLGIGAMRTPKQHAEMLAKTLRQTGAVDTAIPQGDLESVHAEMCERLGWWCHGWTAVGRELARLPDVQRKVIRVNGERLTLYQIEPSADVVSDARRRA